MKCMYAQTRPRFILSSEGVFGGMEFEPMLTPREKFPLSKMSPEEDRTRDAVDSEPKHYQLSYSGPPVFVISFGRCMGLCDKLQKMCVLFFFACVCVAVAFSTSTSGDI